MAYISSGNNIIATGQDTVLTHKELQGAWLASGNKVLGTANNTILSHSDIIAAYDLLAINSRGDTLITTSLTQTYDDIAVGAVVLIANEFRNVDRAVSSSAVDIDVTEIYLGVKVIGDPEKSTSKSDTRLSEIHLGHGLYSEPSISDSDVVENRLWAGNQILADASISSSETRLTAVYSMLYLDTYTAMSEALSSSASMLMGIGLEPDVSRSDSYIVGGELHDAYRMYPDSTSAETESSSTEAEAYPAGYFAEIESNISESEIVKGLLHRAEGMFADQSSAESYSPLAEIHDARVLRSDIASVTESSAPLADIHRSVSFGGVIISSTDADTGIAEMLSGVHMYPEATIASSEVLDSILSPEQPITEIDYDTIISKNVEIKARLYKALATEVHHAISESDGFNVEIEDAMLETEIRKAHPSVSASEALEAHMKVSFVIRPEIIETESAAGAVNFLGRLVPLYPYEAITESMSSRVKWHKNWLGDITSPTLEIVSDCKL